MKRGQNIIVLKFKDTGISYIFGSLSAIYAMFSTDELDITYSALRNAVAAYIKAKEIDDEQPYLQPIYETKRSRFILYRAPLLLAERG